MIVRHTLWIQYQISMISTFLGDTFNWLDIGILGHPVKWAWYRSTIILVLLAQPK